jgi:hypothetical protein
MPRDPIEPHNISGRAVQVTLISVAKTQTLLLLLISVSAEKQG